MEYLGTHPVFARMVVGAFGDEFQKIARTNLVNVIRRIPSAVKPAVKPPPIPAAAVKPAVKPPPIPAAAVKPAGKVTPRGDLMQPIPAGVNPLGVQTRSPVGDPSLFAPTQLHPSVAPVVPQQTLRQRISGIFRRGERPTTAVAQTGTAPAAAAPAAAAPAAAAPAAATQAGAVVPLGQATQGLGQAVSTVGQSLWGNPYRNQVLGGTALLGGGLYLGSRQR